MRLTLLDYVQLILSSLDSDEVNSISDTTESAQIANIVKQTYYNIIARTHLPEHKQLLQLEPSINPAQPVLMYIPDGVADIEWLKYFNSNITQTPPGTSTHGVNTDVVSQPVWNTTSVTSNSLTTGLHTFTVAANLPVQIGQGVTATVNPATSGNMSGTLTSYSGTTMVINVSSVVGTGTFTAWNIAANSTFAQAVPGYENVIILPVRKFIDMTSAFNPADSDVDSFTFSDTSNNYPGNFTLYYKNSRQPWYCTFISDNYVIFDSFDATQDSTLQASKTLAYAQIIPQWIMQDTFIPNIDETQVPLLLNESKSLAFLELKQTVHSKAEQEAKRGWSSVQKDKSKTDKPSYFDQLPDFGRWGRSSYAGLSYFKLRGWDRP